MIPRKFIVKLENNNNLKIIESEVDWKYELGNYCRQYSGSPLLFNNIKNYSNYRLFTGGLSNINAVSLMLGIEKNDSFKTVIKVLKQRFTNPIKPTIFDKKCSPMDCKFKGQIDLNDLPVPWWHELDHGRYIGTWHANISKDPITGIRNAGVYRMKIIDDRHATVSVSPASHLARHFIRAEKLGKDLEMAVAIGVDEEIVIAASAALPYGVDEMCIAGGLLTKPVMVMQCQTCNLEVPIQSEIILEGVIKKGCRVQDGPFMDYSGKISINPDALLFEVNAIQKMNNPVFRGTAVGIAGAEDHLLFSLLSHCGLTDFHGSRIRHVIQCFLLRFRCFKLFQYVGRVGASVKNSKKV